jgi:hypothetical protein
MNNQSKTRRRRFGLVCLGLAVGMVILGVTVLEARLSGVTLLAYWLSCLVLTTLAIGAAVIDLARVGLESREEQRALLEQTLRDVEREKAARKKSRR